MFVSFSFFFLFDRMEMKRREVCVWRGEGVEDRILEKVEDTNRGIIIQQVQGAIGIGPFQPITAEVTSAH